jgi:hypothetical protein
VLKGNNLQEWIERFRLIDLKHTVIDLELEAIIIHGLYYIPSYGCWITRAIILELPRDNDIKASARIDPIILKNLKDKDVRIRFILDIISFLVILVLTIFNLVITYKSNPEKALQVFLLNFTIVVLVVLTNLYYFNFYREIKYELDDFKYFKDIHHKQQTSKKLMIISFLLQSW